MTERAKTIFVVEDDERQRTIVAAFLEARGYRVRPDPSAEAALQRIGLELPDLVLMDVRMPGMNGIEALAEMRTREPALPVILITAYADVRDAVEAMRRGAIDYLEKAVAAGFFQKEWIINDGDLDPLREHPRYKALIEGMG